MVKNGDSQKFLNWFQGRRNFSESGREKPLFSSLPAHQNMTEEEENDLFRARDSYRAAGLTGEAQEIEDFIVQNNLRLIINFVRPYKNNKIFEYRDYFMSAVPGLVKAVKNYDISKGNKFSSYAFWLMRAEVDHAISEYAGFIKKPANYRPPIRVRKLIDDFRAEHNVEPRAEDIQEIYERKFDEAMSKTLAKGYVEFYHHVESYDVLGEEEHGKEDKPCEITDGAAQLIKVLEASIPNERNREIFRLYYLGRDGIPQEREVIAEKFKMSVVNVEKILKKAKDAIRLTVTEKGFVPESLGFK